MEQWPSVKQQKKSARVCQSAALIPPLARRSDGDAPPSQPQPGAGPRQPAPGGLGTAAIAQREPPLGDL